MFRKEAGAALLALLSCTATAYAASGSINDPKGDLPDIVKLAYNNGNTKVAMTMTYATFHPQNESFYMRWGTGTKRYYQVFLGGGFNQLRDQHGTMVVCKGLTVKYPTKLSTKVIVPRSCVKKAPDKLRFQGIATEGLNNRDETKISKAVARG